MHEHKPSYNFTRHPLPDCLTPTHYYIGVEARLRRNRRDQDIAHPGRKDQQSCTHQPVDVRLVFVDEIQAPRRGRLDRGVRVSARGTV